MHYEGKIDFDFEEVSQFFFIGMLVGRVLKFGQRHCCQE
jgi:hypothetical protein